MPGRPEVVPGAEHGVPLAVSPPPAHRTGRHLLIDGDDVDLRFTEEPVYDILPGLREAASRA